jgi:hypothetical protein
MIMTPEKRVKKSVLSDGYDSTGGSLDLGQQYHEIGISAVAAALHYQLAANTSHDENLRSDQTPSDTTH